MPFLILSFIGWLIHLVLVYFHGYIHQWQSWVIIAPISILLVYLSVVAIHCIYKCVRGYRLDKKKEIIIKEIAFWTGSSYDEAGSLKDKTLTGLEHHLNDIRKNAK